MCLVDSIVLSGIPAPAFADTPTYDSVFYYYHPDHLGSAQLMTDRAGEIVQHYGYHTYGSERYRANTSAFSVSSRYTGQTLDEDTGLYYYGARYYDPEVARFIQADSTVPDPEFSQAYNRYAYVYNNPLKFTDPTGQNPFLIAVFIGAYMGGFQGAAKGGVAGFFKGALLGGATAALNGFSLVGEGNLQLGWFGHYEISNASGLTLLSALDARPLARRLEAAVHLKHLWGWLESYRMTTQQYPEIGN